MDYRSTDCSRNSKGKKYLGSCQGNSPSASIQSYYNTTTPTPIPSNGQRNGGGGCDCTVEWTNTSSGSNWLVQGMWQNNPIDPLTVQTFASGSKINFGGCNSALNFGFKNCASKKQWHGTFGFLSNDACERTASIAPDQTKYLTISYDLNYSSNGSHFSGVTITTQESTLIGSCGVDKDTGIVTYGLTGEETDTFDDGVGGGTVTTLQLDNGVGTAYNTDGTVYAHYNDAKEAAGYRMFDPHCTGQANPAGDGDMLSLISYWNESTGDFPSLGIERTALPAVTDVNNYSGTATFWQYSGDPRVNTSTEIVTLSWTKTNTSYTYAYGLTHVDDTGLDTDVISTGTITLLNPYLASDVIKTCESLLSEWDLGNHKIYPYRQDSFTSVAPLVAVREVQNNVSPVIGWQHYMVIDYCNPLTDINSVAPFGEGWIATYDWIPWFDPNDKWWNWVPGSSSLLASSLESTHTDGTIIGKPLKIDAGIGWGFFDFYYTDIHFCKTPTGGGCFGPTYQQYIYRNGGSLADASLSLSNDGLLDSVQYSTFLPMACTNWTNNYQNHNIPEGGYVGNTISDGAIFAVKYCQTRLNYPSYNFFRPCGIDRTLIDETTALCFTDDLTMESELVGMHSGSQVLLTFTNGFDGIYVSCSQDISSHVLTLGTKIQDLLPSYYHPFEEQFKDADTLGNYGLVGLVRFPEAWSTCGRESITVSPSGSDYSKVSFTNPQYCLRTADSIDLYKDNTMTASVSDKHVTRIDNSNYVVTASFSGSITSSIFAQSHGSPDYHWYDSTPKYEFRFGDWTTSNRNPDFSSSSSCYSNCIKVSPCSPPTVVFSPNIEHFGSGSNTQQFWFSNSPCTSSSTNLDIDDSFGSYKSQMMNFFMTDLLFQVPKAPCSYFGVSVSIAPDKGLCQTSVTDEYGNITLFYPIPLVEAICSLPPLAPALPDGITFSPLSQPLAAGVPGYSFNVSQMPWTLVQNQLLSCPCALPWNYPCPTS